MLDPATARLCVWRLPLEAAFRLFSKLGSLGGSIRERFSRTGRTRPALARPAFSRWLLENDRLRERWPCQWLNVLYFPFSETSPRCGAPGSFAPDAGPDRSECRQTGQRPPRFASDEHTTLALQRRRSTDCTSTDRHGPRPTGRAGTSGRHDGARHALPRRSQLKNCRLPWQRRSPPSNARSA